MNLGVKNESALAEENVKRKIFKICGKILTTYVRIFNKEMLRFPKFTAIITIRLPKEMHVYLLERHFDN